MLHGWLLSVDPLVTLCWENQNLSDETLCANKSHHLNCSIHVKKAHGIISVLIFHTSNSPKKVSYLFIITKCYWLLGVRLQCFLALWNFCLTTDIKYMSFWKDEWYRLMFTESTVNIRACFYQKRNISQANYIFI